LAEPLLAHPLAGFGKLFNALSDGFANVFARGSSLLRAAARVAFGACFLIFFHALGPRFLGLFTRGRLAALGTATAATAWGGFGSSIFGACFLIFFHALGQRFLGLFTRGRLAALGTATAATAGIIFTLGNSHPFFCGSHQIVGLFTGQHTLLDPVIQPAFNRLRIKLVSLSARSTLFAGGRPTGLRFAVAIASSRISALGGFGALGLIFLHAFGPRFPGVFAAGRAVSVLCVAGNDAHSGGQHDEGKFAQFHNFTVFL
jgi:hypothetical protein